jgi:hypothetical protein
MFSEFNIWALPIEGESICFVSVLVLQQLGQHGVIIQTTVPGYYIVQGRADYLMIIGRIKVEHHPLDVFSKLLSSNAFHETKLILQLSELII